MSRSANKHVMPAPLKNYFNSNYNSLLVLQQLIKLNFNISKKYFKNILLYNRYEIKNVCCNSKSKKNYKNYTDKNC